MKEKTLKVLEILKENDLYLKPEKCVFEATHIEYLGYVIEEGKIMMDPVKVKGIVDWPAPTTLKQLRSFLGFCNYYRKFIKKYLDKCCVLNELLQKEEPRSLHSPTYSTRNPGGILAILVNPRGVHLDSCLSQMPAILSIPDAVNSRWIPPGIAEFTRNPGIEPGRIPGGQHKECRTQAGFQVESR